MKARKDLWLAFFNSLVVPALLLAFFIAAPYWLNDKIHSELANAVNSNTNISLFEKQERLDKIAHLDFQQVCFNPPAGFEKLHDNLAHAGIAARFRRLQWGLILSAVLVAGLATAIWAIFALNGKATKSQADLIRSYQLSWKIGMAAALAKVFLLIPLLAYGAYEFTVLLSGKFFPKLLVMIIFGGVFALWRSATILLKKVPLEFKEPMSREVKPEDAPELWEAVRDAARGLQTTPPDRIVIGMQFNFYVTELAVCLDSGHTEGKTLYLSYPLLKQLSGDQVLAIIGHELGHFIGEDTRMTREFYPLRLKIHATMIALARSGWVGWPSFQLLNFFRWCFGETEGAASRARELLADQKAAALTTPRTAANALVRFHVASEAFRRGLADAPKSKIENPLDVPLHAVVREKLAADPEFWHQLFEQKLPHPLDTHPSLHDRLEALGQNFSAADARNIALAESKSAYSEWFSTRDALFTNLAQKAQAVMGKIHLAQATIETQPLISDFQTKFWFVATILMFAVIGMIPIILLGLFAQFHFAGPDFQLSRFLILPILLVAATPGFLFGLRFARKQLKKQFWRLTATELSCGISRPQSFPLADIEKIIAGLPVDNLGKMFQRAKPGTVAGASVAMLSTVDPRWNTVKALYLARAKKENSLLICFKDGSWLPLRLFLFPNGTAIMEELKARFKDRLVLDYNYSAEEARRLHRCDVNELIPPPKQPKKCYE